MKMTTFEEFKALAVSGTFVPVCKELMADLLTPASAFLKVAEHSDYAFLFESVEGGEHVARYSFLGKDPFVVLRSCAGRVMIERAGSTNTSNERFMAALKRMMLEVRTPLAPHLPRFTGGAVGFLSYDAATWIQSGDALPPAPVPATPGDESGFMFFDTVLAFDHVKHRILLISNARLHAHDDLEAQYRFACARIGFLERELRRALSQEVPSGGRLDEPHASVTRAAFERTLNDAGRRITADHLAQVTLSHRLDVRIHADPFAVYRALRHLSPAPYMYFIRLGNLAVVGSSPETLVRVEDGVVQAHPVSGIRSRGRTRDEDARIADGLLCDQRERREHAQLVDIGREELSNIAEVGSVRVSTFMEVERYSHAMHLVSVVDGRLASGHHPLDALVACFPAGTVSGVPKARAMKMIPQLESGGRGLYGGAVGYVDFAGNLDFCIAARTIVITDGQATWQIAVRMDRDADAAVKYNEALEQAQPLIETLRLAEAGLHADPDDQLVRTSLEVGR